MPREDHRVGDVADRAECRTQRDEANLARPSAARARAVDEASSEIARQLNGPLTALLLYMGEISQHSHLFAHTAADKVYLQTIVHNALEQTERVCALVKQIAGDRESSVDTLNRTAEARVRRVREKRMPGAVHASDGSRKPLTRREREVLNLIS